MAYSLMISMAISIAIKVLLAFDILALRLFVKLLMAMQVVCMCL